MQEALVGNGFKLPLGWAYCLFLQSYVDGAHPQHFPNRSGNIPRHLLRSQTPHVCKTLIISTVPGTGVSDIEQALTSLNLEGGISFFNVERRARALAQQQFQDGPLSDLAHRTSFFYSLPEETVGPLIEQAVRDGAHHLAKSGQRHGVLFTHSTFISPLRQTPYQPYVRLRIAEIVQEQGATLTGVISIHDDIYDVHRHLLDTKFFVRPLDRLTLFDSFRELNFVLRWRQLELTAAKSVAQISSVPHNLLHKKGLVQNLVRIGFNSEPSVYLSHPISQSRRHWTQTKSEECPNPDPSKGTAFANEVGDVVRRLSEHFAVVEPAAIDELRLDKDLLRSGDLRGILCDIPLNERLFPPLTNRWPLWNPMARIVRETPDECDGRGFRLIPADILPSDTSFFTDETDLQPLVTRAEQLVEEIKVHITMRDYQLTDQAEVVLVFRPHSSDGSPRLSGGVGDEIQAKLQKRQLELDERPSIFVIHPWLDEQQRRRLVFDSAAVGGGPTPPRAGYREACTGFCQADPPAAFKAELLDLVLDAPYFPDRPKLKQSIRSLIGKHHLRFKARSDESAMGEMPFISEEEAQDAFVDYFVEGELFNPLLFKEASVNNPVVQVFDEQTVTAGIIETINRRLYSQT